VRPTGFFQQKAKTIQRACRVLVDRHGGQVPSDIEALVKIPGVGRKTANVVLVTAFGIKSGVIVDTHVKRLAGRLGLSKQEDADAIEEDLMRLLDQDDWLWWPAAVILFGRDTCTAKKPRCQDCVLADVCPRVGVA
jgi:endonuclease-3